MPVSDNTQSGASMVIYGGMGECAYTVNGVDVGICVLESCLTHAWVFAMAFQFGTNSDGCICNQISTSKRRPYLLLKAIIAPPSIATLPEEHFE